MTTMNKNINKEIPKILNFANKDGEYKRQTSSFRNWISESTDFKPEPHRYHLYISYACPWAHRTLIYRALKNLENVMTFSCVDDFLGAEGWTFGQDHVGQSNDHLMESELKRKEGERPLQKKVKSEDERFHDKTGTVVIHEESKDPLYNMKYLSEIYYKANLDYQGRFTVPVLWDKKRHTIVNNESSEIIRMLNIEFNGLSQSEFPEINRDLDLYPESLRTEIDGLNEWIYDQINNGVYKSGFATTQEAYEKNVNLVYQGLARVEQILASNYREQKGSKSAQQTAILNLTREEKIDPLVQVYLTGNRLTEADVRLFTTIVRFDPVYHTHFKCNAKLISKDYPHLFLWLKRIYNIPKISQTVCMQSIKNHYFKSHIQINPYGIVPTWNGPDLLELEEEN